MYDKEEYNLKSKCRMHQRRSKLIQDQRFFYQANYWNATW